VIRQESIIFFTKSSFSRIFSCHVEKISIFFVIELASQSGVLNEQLTSTSISKLCIQKLYSMSSTEFMDTFFKKVYECLEFLFDFRQKNKLFFILKGFH
jgi:hypothetical protein